MESSTREQIDQEVSRFTNMLDELKKSLFFHSKEAKLDLQQNKETSAKLVINSWLPSALEQMQNFNFAEDNKKNAQLNQPEPQDDSQFDRKSEWLKKKSETKEKIETQINQIFLDLDDSIKQDLTEHEELTEQLASCQQNYYKRVASNQDEKDQQIVKKKRQVQLEAMLVSQIDDVNQEIEKKMKSVDAFKKHIQETIFKFKDKIQFPKGLDEFQEEVKESFYWVNDNGEEEQVLVSHNQDMSKKRSYLKKGAGQQQRVAAIRKQTDKQQLQQEQPVGFVYVQEGQNAQKDPKGGIAWTFNLPEDEPNVVLKPAVAFDIKKD